MKTINYNPTTILPTSKGPLLVALLTVAFFLRETHQESAVLDSSSKFISLLDKLNEYAFGKLAKSNITSKDLESAYEETIKWTIKETVEFETHSPLILELNSLLFAFMEGKKYGIESASDVHKFQNYYSYLMPEFENMKSIQYAPGPKTEDLFYSLLGVGGEKRATKELYDAALEEYQNYLNKFHSFPIGSNEEEAIEHPTLDEILAYLSYDLSRALAKCAFQVNGSELVKSDADLEPIAKELAKEVYKMGYIVEDGKIINVMPKID